MTTAEQQQVKDTIPTLITVAEKVLQTRCKPGVLNYCPTMDLVALACEDDQVHVFRLNGQRVFGGAYAGIAGGEGAGVRTVRWKPNGHLLAVVCSDNIIRIVSAYSGKTVHTFPCGPSLSPSLSQQASSSPTSASVSCLGWGLNLTDGNASLKNLQEADGRLTVDDLLTSDTQLSKLAQLKADLPRELALLDIERSLPKLSTLPSTGDEDDVFSSRASIDSIFHATNKASSDSVDVLVAGFDDGTLHLRIFDSFEIGYLNVGDSFGPSEASRALLHSSHPISSTHSLLFSTTDSSMKLLTLDLRFITKSGRYLSLLASKTTQLQNLLRYIKQVQHQIQLEWKNTQELPGRFIGNATEDLQAGCSCDFVTAAYHLLVTGDCFEPLKEFLVDQLGERGHKRWDKAVTSGYENLRRLTHECLLPALERCGVLLSRLIGLSKFHKLSPILGLETRTLIECQDTVDCLNLLSHKVLIHAGRELREFTAFSKWLKHEVDLQTADPLGTTAEELQEKSDSLDYAETLSYIQGAMTHSALHAFIPPTGAEALPDRCAPAGQDSSFYETYRKLLRQHGQGKLAEGVTLPLLSDLIARLGLQYETVFNGIAETQRRGILHRSPLSLGSDCEASIADMTMNYGPFEDDTFSSVFIATKSKKSPYMFYLYRVVLNCVNGVSSTKGIFLATLSLQSGNIARIRFVEDGTLILLWTDGKGTTHLINFPYAPDETADFHVDFDKIDDGANNTSTSQSRITDIRLDSKLHARFTRHTFPPQQEPEEMELAVNGRKGRRVVCVLYSDKLRYSVFDLDNQEEAEEQEEGEQGEQAEEAMSD